jgi:serine protease AprX
MWRATTRVQQASSSYNGSGVGVALLDTGVVPVSDLANRVVYRADLTPEGDGLDRFGHGTHMAGIIAGDGTSSAGNYVGVAPRANLISVKVAGFNGATDVSVVIAGLQWVVSHRNQFNIKVLNLSFGTDSTQSYKVDPLDHAVEQTWKSGILVVVSAGNRGSAAGTINKPADDPYVVTVGAADIGSDLSKSDERIPEFSSRGPTQDGLSKPDLVAPGISIVSVRDPNSTIDQLHPQARVNDSYFKGTGTSQAAAVVSGVGALMFQANPSLTPDVAKAILMGTAKNYNDLTGQPGAGSGLVDAFGATNAAKSGAYQNSPANQGLTPSSGTGSLEASRGSQHVYADITCEVTENVMDPVTGAVIGTTTTSSPLGTPCYDGKPELVQGEVTALANSWSANSWSTNSWSGYTWEANSWSANSWSANSWSGMQWDANSWSANSWSANSWSANSWSANSWSANSWSANSWSANSWSANSWSANAWS